jgi:hypothetical protein
MKQKPSSRSRRTKSILRSPDVEHGKATSASSPKVPLARAHHGSVADKPGTIAVATANDGRTVTWDLPGMLPATEAVDVCNPRFSVLKKS